MLGLARGGIPLAKFFQFTNTALGKAIADPTRYLSGPTPAGEKFIPDTAILHPPRKNLSMDDYQARVGAFLQALALLGWTSGRRPDEELMEAAEELFSKQAPAPPQAESPTPPR